MNTELAAKPSTTFSHAQLYSLVSAYSGAGRPADDTPPRPPGPWDPVIRTAGRSWFLGIVALRNAHLHEALHPHVASTLSDRLGRVALNPQPLPPPRRALMITIAETVISRAELLLEFANAGASEEEQRGIIIVSGYVGRFVRDFTQPTFRLPVDDFTPIEFKPKFPWPWPWPVLDFDFFPTRNLPTPPDEPLPISFNPGDYLAFGETFATMAKRTFDHDLRHVFEDAAARFADTAAARLK